MSVKQRKWTSKGSKKSAWTIHIVHVTTEGQKKVIRENSPVNTKRGAEQYERQVRQQLLDGSFVPKSERGKTTKQCDSNKSVTLAVFAAVFLDHQGANSRGEQKEKRRNLDLHILPALGHLRLDKVDKRAVDEFTAQQVKRGYGDTTIANHRQTLRALLRFAKSWDLIDKVPDIPTAKKAGRLVYLEEDETEALLANAGEGWFEFILLAVRAGLRLGELRGLHWKNVDLSNRTVWVVDNYTNEDGWGLPKSGKPRLVPLALDVAQAMERIRPARPRSAALVWPGKVGPLCSQGKMTPLTHTVINGAINRAALKAGIQKPIDQKVRPKLRPQSELKHKRRVRTPRPRSGVTAHVLRHTFGTAASSAGVPMPQIKSWMGHADISTTLQYVHLSPAQSHDWIDRLVPDLRGTQEEHKGSAQKENRPLH